MGAVGEIFISHASADSALAARVAEGLRQAGHSIFLDSDQETGIVPGAAWQRTLLRELRICDAVVFLNSRAGQASMWCHSELVVATDLGKRVFSLDLGPGLAPHPLLGSLQGIRFDSAIDAGIRRLADSLSLDGLAGSTRLRWERGRPPYPGLAAMDVADAGVFFGRDGEVGDLVARVGGPLGQPEGDLVVVHGPSGAGKSSLVRAGLAARLALPRTGWAVADPFEPGLRPLDRLLSQLAALIPGQLTADDCGDRLKAEGLAAFGDWLASRIGVPARRLLITVDQAEQLVTVTAPGEREEFLRVLGGGLGPGSPVTIVMTVRSDRLDEIQQLPEIGPAVHAPFYVPPISRSRLAMVVEGPARRAGLAFAPGLVGRLIDDAVRDSNEKTADALPFLAFVLREMYDLAVEEDRAALTDADYERVGRIEGAIKRRAEAAEASLPPGSGPVLERLLPRFVTLSEGRPAAARPVPRESLPADEQTVAERLQDQRLLVSTRDGDTVRLAHEQLITTWPRLTEVIADRREDLLLQARLERQSTYWKRDKDKKAGLLGRDASDAARSWLARQARQGTSHADIDKYVCASEAALRRRRTLAVSVVSAIAVLALVASAVAGWAAIQRSDAVHQARLAAIQRSDAVRQARLAAAQTLLARAGELRASRISQSLLLGIAAMKVSPGQQARSALISTLIGSHSPTTLPGDGTEPLAVAFTPDGRRLFTSYSPAGYLWDVTGRGQPHQLSGLSSEGAWAAAFSRDGRLLATGSANGRTLLWDTADLAGPLAVLPGDGTWVTSVAFSPDGHRLLMGNWDNSVQRNDKALLWDVSIPSAPRLLATLRIAGSGPVRGVAFSHDGRIGYTANDNGTVGIWDVAHPDRVPVPIGVLRAHLNTVYAVAVSPDGQTMMTGSADRTAALWSLANPARPVRLAVLAGHRGGVRAVAFSPDGTTAATASLDSTAILWRIADRSAPVRLDTLAGDSQALWGLAFSPDAKTLATSSSDGSVTLWNVTDRAQPVSLSSLAGHKRNSNAPVLAYSPNGRVLASGGWDARTVLWDVTDPRHPRTLSTLTAQTGTVFTVAFRPDGMVLATGSWDGTVMLWNVTTPAAPYALATIPVGSPVDTVGFTSDGRTLAVGDDAGTATLFDIANPADPRRLGATASQSLPIRVTAFTPDGRTLVTGSTNPDDEVRVWDVTDRLHPRELSHFTDGNSAYSGGFGPDGHTLALAEEGRKTSLWNLANRAAPKRLATMLGQASSVYTSNFSRDGTLLASGGFDKTVIIWDVSDRRAPGELIQLSGFPEAIGSAVFSPDGRTLAISGGSSPTLWDISYLHHIVLQPVQAACDITARGLSPAQWRDEGITLPYQPTC